MSRLSDFIKENKESVYLFANNNTPKNQDGKAMIPKDDEWNSEVEWDKMFKEMVGK